MRTRRRQPHWHGTVPDFPELYDLLHADHSDDIELYERLSAQTRVLLECGVGTGRVALALARRGKVIHGIDSSAAMLASLRRKLAQEPVAVARRVHPRCADMTSFQLNRAFRFCYVPFMTFNYLSDIHQQLSCLERLRHHLERKGTLVLELMSYHRDWFFDDGIARLVARGSTPDRSGTFEIWRTTRFDAATQTMEHDRHYRFYDSTGLLKGERTILLRNRFLFEGEMRLLLQASGFAVRDVYGDRHGGPHSKTSQVMIFVAEKCED